MKDQILGRIRSLVRRAHWMHAWDAYLEAAFILTSIVAVLILADRLAFELGILPAYLSRPVMVRDLLLLSLIVSAGFALVAVRRRRVSRAALAWATDQSLHTDALFLSAVDLAEFPSGSAFDDVVIEKAGKELFRVNAQDIVPRPRVKHRWAIALSLLAGGALLLLPPQIASAPRADFFISTIRGNAPLVVRVEEQAMGHIDSYEWNFGDGTRERGRVLSHEYREAGIYPVTLTVVGPGGRHTSEKRDIEVLAREYVVADFVAAPQKGRSPLKVAFRNLSSRADEYRWSFGDGVISGQPHPLHVFQEPGVYTVKLFAQGGGTKDVAEKKIKVVGPDEPLADFVAHPRQGPDPLQVYFLDRSSGPVREYLWDFGDPYAPQSNAKNPVHIYKTPGTYTVTLHVQGPGGEDNEVKEFYIHVGKDGGGGGQGPNSNSNQNQQDLSASPKKPSSLFGKPDPRPKHRALPETVEVPGQGPMVDKVKNIYSNDGGTGSAGKSYKEAYRAYRKAAEEAIHRETIPEPVRDYVRDYFEAIRPQ